MDTTHIKVKPVCAACGVEINGKAYDHSYGIGDTEEVVVQWLCVKCDAQVYDDVPF